MYFTELNSVEYFIIHKLTGVNLNKYADGQVSDESDSSDIKWRYVESDLLQREITDVLFERCTLQDKS